MKKLFITLTAFIFIFNLALTAQVYNEGVDKLIQEVNIDSLVGYVRILSGEDSVKINGEMKRIESRVHSSEGKLLAADYLYNKLSSYGLTVEFQDFAHGGRNVVALQMGTKHPDQYYLICAHFDSVTDYCADDNASGTSAVIEAARILSKEELDYTVIYALWDQEEIGLVGSHYFVQNATAKNYDIKGVLNMDMIGYDIDDDGLMDLHTRDVEGTDEFVNEILSVNSTYSIGLQPVLERPGTMASDHASFIRGGYPAVLFIEAYYNDDFNPWYHSHNDRIDKLNLTYFHKMSKFAFASLANFVMPNNITNNEPQTLYTDYVLEHNYPNPFNPTTNISYTLPKTSHVTLQVHDMLGKVVQVLVRGNQPEGKYRVEFNAEGLPSGTYFYTLTSGDYRETKKMLVVK